MISLKQSFRDKGANMSQRQCIALVSITLLTALATFPETARTQTIPQLGDVCTSEGRVIARNHETRDVIWKSVAATTDEEGRRMPHLFYTAPDYNGNWGSLAGDIPYLPYYIGSTEDAEQAFQPSQFEWDYLWPPNVDPDGQSWIDAAKRDLALGEAYARDLEGIAASDTLLTAYAAWSEMDVTLKCEATVVCRNGRWEEWRDRPVAGSFEVTPPRTKRYPPGQPLKATSEQLGSVLADVYGPATPAFLALANLSTDVCIGNSDSDVKFRIGDTTITYGEVQYQQRNIEEEVRKAIEALSSAKKDFKAATTANEAALDGIRKAEVATSKIEQRMRRLPAQNLSPDIMAVKGRIEYLEKELTDAYALLDRYLGHLEDEKNAGTDSADPVMKWLYKSLEDQRRVVLALEARHKVATEELADFKNRKDNKAAMTKLAVELSKLTGAYWKSRKTELNAKAEQLETSLALAQAERDLHAAEGGMRKVTLLQLETPAKGSEVIQLIIGNDTFRSLQPYGLKETLAHLDKELETLAKHMADLQKRRNRARKAFVKSVEDSTEAANDWSDAYMRSMAGQGSVEAAFYLYDVIKAFNNPLSGGAAKLVTQKSLDLLLFGPPSYYDHDPSVPFPVVPEARSLNKYLAMGGKNGLKTGVSIKFNDVYKILRQDYQFAKLKEFRRTFASDAMIRHQKLLLEEAKAKREAVFERDLKGTGKEFLKGFAWKMVKDLTKKSLKQGLANYLESASAHAYFTTVTIQKFAYRDMSLATNMHIQSRHNYRTLKEARDTLAAMLNAKSGLVYNQNNLNEFKASKGVYTITLKDQRNATQITTSAINVSIGGAVMRRVSPTALRFQIEGEDLARIKVVDEMADLKIDVLK